MQKEERVGLDLPESNNPWHTRYRPKRFSDVVGQEELLFIKKMSLEPAALPPALLFAGPSGVGKTTVARILARAVNCSEKDGADPCLTCPSCATTTDIRITEIDAASFGTADDMRRLREQSLISVGSGGHNVFIIDEAHSISWQGWNVLLKTLEEAQSEALFILVTSEPSKVPLKIRTRTLRFDFSQVPPGPMEGRLREILKEEGVDHIESLDRVIDESKGSMREAIKLLEHMLLNHGGLEQKDLSYELIEAIVRNDHKASLSLGVEWWKRTGDLRGIIEMIGECLEQAALIDYGARIYTSGSKSDKIKMLSDSLNEAQWASMMEVLANWYAEPGNKAALSFMISQLLKAVHGSPARKVKEASVAKESKGLEAEQVGEILKGMKI